MPTNILSLPLLQVAFRTATNESWRDGVAFTAAGSIAGYPTGGNTGTGILADLSVSIGAYLGNYLVTLSSATQYRVTDPDGYVIGSGIVNVPNTFSGVSLTLIAGSTPFAAGDTFTLVVLPKPLDITGIRFAMAMRATAGQATIALSADTLDGTLINGGASGVLGIAVPLSVMEKVATSPADVPYALDIVALADGEQRQCVSGTNAVVAGITFPLSA